MQCKLERNGCCCRPGNFVETQCGGPCENMVPVSNGDHFRSMTDEDLAASGILPCPYNPDGEGECKFGWHTQEQTCEECTLEWLRKPWSGKEK